MAFKSQYHIERDFIVFRYYVLANFIVYRFLNTYKHDVYCHIWVRLFATRRSCGWLSPVQVNLSLFMPMCIYFSRDFAGRLHLVSNNNITHRFVIFCFRCLESGHTGCWWFAVELVSLYSHVSPLCFNRSSAQSDTRVRATDHNPILSGWDR